MIDKYFKFHASHFFRTDSGLCIYQLSPRSSIIPIGSTFLPSPAHSCIPFFFFLVFCCIRFLCDRSFHLNHYINYTYYFSAYYQFLLWYNWFLYHYFVLLDIQVISWKISLICGLKYPYSCCSPHLNWFCPNFDLSFSITFSSMIAFKITMDNIFAIFSSPIFRCCLSDELLCRSLCIWN